jgi:hypothetical protein
VKTPELADRLFKLGVEPVVSTPEEAAQIIAADGKSWAVVKDDIIAATK